MTETRHSNELKSRLVTRFERDGRRRRFDPQAKLELVQTCMQPGVSVARMALDHAVNANLPRKWIRDYERERNGAAASKAIERQAAAFVPVVQIAEGEASVTDVYRRSPRIGIAQSRDGLTPRETTDILELSVEQLHWLLDGIDLAAMRKHPARHYARVN